MIRPMRHGLSPRLLALQSILSPSRRESLPAPSAGDRIIGSAQERISWVGRLLRRKRLDEVPQLFNILIGQMSIIGPRPLLLRDLHEDGADRIRMRPGVTGWAQINGGKLISRQDKMALDLWYAHHASFRLDLIILWRTV